MLEISITVNYAYHILCGWNSLHIHNNDRRIYMKAVNWNTQEDMTNMFWRQNISQMWVETEFKVSKDIASWKTLTDSEKETFKKALAGLTGLDTHQADDGMPLIMLHTTDLRKSCILFYGHDGTNSR